VNVLLVILHADAARGGAERYTLDLAAALVGRGHRVSLAARSFAAVPAGVLRVPLGASGRTRAGQYRRFLDSLDAHLAATTYDVVHAMLPVRACDLYHPHAGLAAEALAAGHLKRRHAGTRALSRLANRLNARRRAFAEVERQLLTGPHPPRVLCLSEAMQKTVRRHYALPADRLATLFNAVDLERFDPAAHPQARTQCRQSLGLSEEAPAALMIAQDFQRKGLPEALGALAELAKRKKTPAHLVVVGRPKPGRYQRLAQELGIAGRVMFAGPTADPYPFYAAADFFILPTHHDPCSLVVLEALAMGLPVITTRRNGAAEIMTSGTEGFVLEDPGDRAGLVEGWSMLLDPARRKAMSAAALALRPRLSYEHHLQTLLALYDATPAGHTSARRSAEPAP
jgi:UDP-glucose:(heptosyl)LPS alpha-1,3-glucosyltransferase